MAALARPSLYIFFAIFFVFLLAIQYRYAQQHFPLIEMQRLLVSPSAMDKSEVRRAAEKDLVKRLYYNPLDQNALAAYFKLRDPDISPVTRKRFLVALNSVGWRSVFAQQTIISEAVKKADFKTIVERSDALLRRNQARDEILQLLSLAETSDQTSDVLVKRLRSNPPWRKDFFQRASLLRTDQQVSGRVKTLQTMIDNGYYITRSELVPASNALIKAGNYQPVLGLVRSYKKVSGNDAQDLSDSKFQTLASVLESGDRLLPFEWQPGDSKGLSVRAENVAGKSSLRVRWNGRGLPIFLTRRLYLQNPSSIKIALDIRPNKLEAAQVIQINATCPGQTVALEPSTPTNAGSMIWRSREEISCNFPLIKIGSKPAFTRRNLDVMIDSALISNLDTGAPI
ncbi:hypothetical protein [Parasphingorhabdus sp.]|uniref:hypothetical protein n=1 Tax=Parasphingorhabdus sp. TaxID=2709688 RepID=UPI003A943D80